MNKRLDLNLLPIAVGLYEEHGVGKAAPRLGISQAQSSSSNIGTANRTMIQGTNGYASSFRNSSVNNRMSSKAREPIERLRERADFVKPELLRKRTGSRGAIDHRWKAVFKNPITIIVSMHIAMGSRDGYH